MTHLEPGSVAPDFTLLDQDERPVSLSDFRGRRVILYFYPAAMTPGCTTQACDFRDSMGSLQGAGYTVLGISRDEPAKLREFRENDAITFPLLSDPDHAVHEAYGAWGEKQNYGKTYMGIQRSTFVIDPDGVVRHVIKRVKPATHDDAVLKKLSELQAA